ncbi:hypothetical protein Ae263Ps1_5441 [Pseudonocardia sp. Ae263_Ps1]|nr:hypothetical protein Ae150APs1_5878c [Pseudonocardia sp. Ae150A_Ps1]OLL88386.1 hypothetical protein Ae263Ps1_5441 [Pseudonocardia sp. Ae263_Ps1]OLL91590.1 hypothetical protein Ae356Ps1_1487c [Pseudonocardia sp. Ae356_Ps1]
MCCAGPLHRGRRPRSARVGQGAARPGRLRAPERPTPERHG